MELERHPISHRSCFHVKRPRWGLMVALVSQTDQRSDRGVDSFEQRDRDSDRKSIFHISFQMAALNVIRYKNDLAAVPAADISQVRNFPLLYSPLKWWSVGPLTANYGSFLSEKNLALEMGSLGGIFKRSIAGKIKYGLHCVVRYLIRVYRVKLN